MRRRRIRNGRVLVSLPAARPRSLPPPLATSLPRAVPCGTSRQRGQETQASLLRLCLIYSLSSPAALPRLPWSSPSTLVCISPLYLGLHMTLVSIRLSLAPPPWSPCHPRVSRHLLALFTLCPRVCNRRLSCCNFGGDVMAPVCGSACFRRQSFAAM
jgi:hypothetical protein